MVRVKTGMATSKSALMHLLLLWLCLFLANASTEKISFNSLRGMELLHKEEQQQQQQPQQFFEVARPILPSNLKPCKSMKLLHHSFGNTINSAATTVKYVPPTFDDGSCEWDTVVLRWKATCKGRQFDRISAVWLSGVEILRTSTAEPTKTGIFWTVSKDVTKYASLFRRPQILAVSLGNVVDNTYTGIFNVTIHLDFYEVGTSGNCVPAGSPSASPLPLPSPSPSPSVVAPGPVPADLVYPIALPNSTNGGYWFQVHGENDAGLTSFRLPKNVYKAELEVYVSFHGDDEFWYLNPTNDYIQLNNLTGTAGNGPYREVLAILDGGTIVAEIVPLPVIFTGGINPLMWRPAAAIGAFNLPSYTFDVTPFLGTLLDGKPHSITLMVTNSLNFWLLDANLHLWLDHGTQGTSGGLVSYDAPYAEVDLESQFTGLDGVLKVRANRSLSYSGFVLSSHGNITTTSSYSYKFDNTNTFSQQGNVESAEQNIASSSKVVVTNGDDVVTMEQLSRSFPFHFASTQSSGPNQTLNLDVTISHGRKEQLEMVTNGCKHSNSLDNEQDSRGAIVIQNGNTVISGFGELQQRYTFDSSDSEDCYSRKIKTRNYTIMFDEISRKCTGEYIK